MTVSAFSGAIVAFGLTSGMSPDNPNAGTSLAYGGWGILDTRYAYTYKPGQSSGRLVAGWLGSAGILSINGVPYTKAVAAIAAAANAVSGVAMTLVSAASATTGISLTTTLVNQSTGVTDTASLVVLDGYASCTAVVAGNLLTVSAVTSPTIVVGMTVLTVGGTVTGTTPVGMKIMSLGTGTGGIGTYYLNATAGSALTGTVTLNSASPLDCLIAGNTASGMTSSGGVQVWNPQALTARCVAITAAAGASGTVVFTVRGYDIYGYPMIETITAAANTQTSGKKAFKYIKSVTPGSSDAQNYSVDTTDVFGYPIRTDFFGDSSLNYSASLSPAVITANTGYLASVQTAPTATTGDVRGTYALQTASATNTNRLMIRQSPPPANVTTDTGLYGAAQFSTGF